MTELQKLRMYCSTRGQVNNVSFEQTLFSGYADDGGLFVPKIIPKLSKEELNSWRCYSYQELAQHILPLFISESEIPSNDLSELIKKSYVKFNSPEVVGVAKLNNGLNVLELFYGPTMTFKDVALQAVGQLLNYFLTKRGQHCTILVGTSGDTGSSAIEAVKDIPSVDIIVILPKGRCTEFQERQMTTAIADNVYVYRADGTSDDLDQPIKHCFADIRFSAEHKLISINSINWARVLLQIVHFFYAYFKVTTGDNELVEFVIPTGGCGNLTAGCIARQMGLPVSFVSAVNSNDAVSRLLTTGQYLTSKSVVKTYASAMDIQMAYNLERIFWLFSGGDCCLVRKIFEEFEHSLDVVFPDDVLNNIKSAVKSHRVDDDKIKEAIRHCWRENSYLVCPHTATAVHYHYSREPDASVTRICVATAAPIKFEEAIQAAGVSIESSKLTEKLYSLPTRYEDWTAGDDWDAALRKSIENIAMKYKTNC